MFLEGHFSKECLAAAQSLRGGGGVGGGGFKGFGGRLIAMLIVGCQTTPKQRI